MDNGVLPETKKLVFSIFSLSWKYKQVLSRMYARVVKWLNNKWMADVLHENWLVSEPMRAPFMHRQLFLLLRDQYSVESSEY